MDESTPCSLEKKYYKDAMDWYYYLCVMLSRVQFFVTPQTVAHQAPLSMEFSRQGYRSGLPFPSPEDLPDPGIEPRSPALQADSLPRSHQGSLIPNTG